MLSETTTRSAPATTPSAPRSGSNPVHKPAGKSQASTAKPKLRRWEKQINWPIVAWLSLVHVGALFAPFTFTWQGLVALVVLHWITGGLGVCLGYHRLLTHTSFQTYRPIRWFFGVLGGLSGEGSAIDWVANHRQHHAHSDQEDDPHSPHDGGWWSHVFWLAFGLSNEEHKAHTKRWVPDLLKDKVLVWIGRMFLPLNIAMGVLLLAGGWWWGGASLGVSLLVWGLFLRMALVLHCTWFVNSASHMWGYKNYATTDDSRNNWWVALITYGEGWHNNHHAYPRMANHGHRWWEFDITFRTVRLMQRLGLVWSVVDYKQKTLDSSVKEPVKNDTNDATAA